VFCSPYWEANSCSASYYIFIHSMEPARFITVFTTAATGPYSKPEESSPLSHSIPLRPTLILPAAYLDLVGTMTRQRAGTRNRYSCLRGSEISLFFKVSRQALGHIHCTPRPLYPREKILLFQLNKWLGKSQRRYWRFWKETNLLSLLGINFRKRIFRKTLQRRVLKVNHERKRFLL